MAERIGDRTEIDEIIRRGEVCRIAFARENTPYLVPVSFGYDGKAIYFHTGRRGRKIEFMTANPTVCFEVECDVELMAAGTNPCRWSFAYRSVIGTGGVAELTEPAEKRGALDRIVAHYRTDGDVDFTYEPDMLEKVRVWKIEIGTVTGKQSKRRSG